MKGKVERDGQRAEDDVAGDVHVPAVEATPHRAQKIVDEAEHHPAGRHQREGVALARRRVQIHFTSLIKKLYFAPR